MSVLNSTIQAVQQELRRRKLYHGEIDGIAGSATWAAIHESLLGPTLGVVSNPGDTNIDSRTLAVIQTLHAATRPKFTEFYHALRRAGLIATPKFISGLRTYEEQDALYAQGRSKPGQVVTKAPAGYSNHNFGIAIDIGFFDIIGRYVDDLADRRIDGWTYDKADSLYRKAGEIGKSIGLEWGGDWKSIKDYPHFQFRPQWAHGLEESAMLAEMRRRKASGRDIWA